MSRVPPLDSANGTLSTSGFPNIVINFNFPTSADIQDRCDHSKNRSPGSHDVKAGTDRHAHTPSSSPSTSSDIADHSIIDPASAIGEPANNAPQLSQDMVDFLQMLIQWLQKMLANGDSGSLPESIKASSNLDRGPGIDEGIGGNDQRDSSGPVEDQTSQPASLTRDVVPGSDTSAFNAGPNPEIGKWSGAISKAAQATGLDPNLIGAQIWAESRGNPNDNSTNSDGTTDYGLMQIGQERWKNEIVPNLTAAEKNQIKTLTGKDASQLDMRNPEDNVIGGSFEIQQWIKQKGSVEEGLRFYVSGGDASIGSPSYVQDVLEYQRALKAGARLRD